MCMQTDTLPLQKQLNIYTWSSILINPPLCRSWTYGLLNQCTESWPPPPWRTSPAVESAVLDLRPVAPPVQLGKQPQCTSLNIKLRDRDHNILIGDPNTQSLWIFVLQWNLGICNEMLGSHMKIFGSPTKIWGLQWEHGVSNDNITVSYESNGVWYK